MNKGVLSVVLAPKGEVAPLALEVIEAGRQLAKAAGEPFSAAVIGAGLASAAQDLAGRGPEKVFTIDHPGLAQFRDEVHARALAELAEREKPGKVLLAATAPGRALAARASVLLKAGFASEVAGFKLTDGGLQVQRALYSGNVLGDVEFKTPTAVLTIQPMAWPRAEPGQSSGQVVAAPFDPAAKPSRTEFVRFQPEESQELDIATAERVVSGGRGLAKPEGFEIIRQLAHALGAAVGASRAAVDSGWIAYRHQVGLTGRTVKPKLYVACGISGQIQHLAGMSASGTIVAINSDAACPMMQLANISVVGDLFELIPLIVQEVRKRK